MRPWLLSVLGCLAACGDPATAGPDVPPAVLSATGLYADLPGRVLAKGVRPFAPQFALWTDGAEKQRWLWLPPGTAVDASDPDHWRFPVGSKLWKEFAFDGPVETRYLEHTAEGRWLRVTYRWRPDGSDADLAPEQGVPAAAHSAPGVSYDIPSRAACRACHDAGGGPVLGFGALQQAPHLRELVRQGVLRGLPAALLAEPPAFPGVDAREREVLGYLHGNCGSCHNRHGPLAPLGLDLLQGVGRSREQALAPLLTGTRHFAEGTTPLPRVHPGEPARSALWLRLASSDPNKRMPPQGTRVPDPTALAGIADWIRGLASNPHPNPKE